MRLDPYEVYPVDSNVLRFCWARPLGWVIDSRTKWKDWYVDYDLSIFLRNVAVAGALAESARRARLAERYRDDDPSPPAPGEDHYL